MIYLFGTTHLVWFNELVFVDRGELDLIIKLNAIYIHNYLYIEKKIFPVFINPKNMLKTSFN